MSDELLPVVSSPPGSTTAFALAPASERLALDQLHEQLEFVRAVMRQEMRDGQDYGKIPGCGDKPGLFQPGAQKLLMTFQLTPHVKKEVLRELPHPSVAGHREYEFTISVQSRTGREWDGVGTCSTFEPKYRWHRSQRKCPACGKETILKSKNAPFGWFCWSKKGGCGMNFPATDPAITSQEEGRAENENPAEYWNTVRKMAFKRAIVHAAINATNTSELWSQDLEDLPQARVERPEPPWTPEPPSTPAQAAPTPPGPVSGPKPEPVKAEATTRMRALNFLQAAPGQGNRGLFRSFLLSKMWITGDQSPEDWPLEHVPTMKKAMVALAEEVEEFGRSIQPNAPEEPQ